MMAGRTELPARKVRRLANLLDEDGEGDSLGVVIALMSTFQASEVERCSKAISAVGGGSVC